MHDFFKKNQTLQLGAHAVPFDLIDLAMGYLDPIPYFYKARRISRAFCYVIEHIMLPKTTSLSCFKVNKCHSKFADDCKTGIFAYTTTLNTDLLKLPDSLAISPISQVNIIAQNNKRGINAFNSHIRVQWLNEVFTGKDKEKSYTMSELVFYSM